MLVISVIAVNNNKGGVLKTSIVTNLAGILANNGNRVLIIDADHQGNALLSFGRNPDLADYTLYDVLVGRLAPEVAIETVYTRKSFKRSKRGSIDVLMSNDDMIEFDFEVIGNRDHYANPFYLLRETVGHIIDDYDHVLIDSSPSMSLMIANIFSFPDVGVLIPMQCEQYSRRSLVKTLGAVSDFREKHNPSMHVLGIVPTLFDSRTNLHHEVLQDVRRYGAENNVRVFETGVPHRVRYASSVAYDALPLTIADPKHKSSKVYDKLAKELGLIG